jgi:NADH-quinone oxidoreductase subunit C
MEIQAYKEKVVEAITAKLGQAPINVEIQYDFVVIEIQKANIYSILDFLKNHPVLKLDFLTTMCGIHFNDGGEREFGLMYQLHNMQTNERLRIRTFMSRTDLDMPTISTIFPTANWMEREAFDFYGFNFVGHPSLTRILNMDEMNYFPLRREYALEDEGRTDKDDKYFGR